LLVRIQPEEPIFSTTYTDFFSSTSGRFLANLILRIDRTTKHRTEQICEIPRNFAFRQSRTAAIADEHRVENRMLIGTAPLTARGG
jgi:hypothetical protein